MHHCFSVFSYVKGTDLAITTEGISTGETFGNSLCALQVVEVRVEYENVSWRYKCEVKKVDWKLV
jgi:hypothetical protein